MAGSSDFLPLMLAALQADPTVTQLFGNGGSPVTSWRLFPGVAPQNAVTPYARYQVIADPPVNSLSGFSGLQNARVQWDVIGDEGNYLATSQAADAIDNVLKDVQPAAALGFCSLRKGGNTQYDKETKQDMVISEYSIWRNI